MPEGKVLKPGDIIPQAGAWEGFQANIFGFEMIDFTSFDLIYEAEFETNYGKGGQPVSWSIKKYKRTGGATLGLEQMTDLFNEATIFGGDLLMLPPLPVTASCQMEKYIFKLIIPAAKIIKFPLNWKEGQSKTEVPLEFGITSYPIIKLV